MADNKKRLEEMQRLLNEINKVYSSLNEKSPFGNDAKNLENSTNQVKILEDSLEGINQRASIFNSSLNDAFTSFKSIVQEIKKSDSGVRATAKSFNAFSDTARKVRDHQEGISILSVKQIQKEQEKLKSTKANLQSNISLLEQQKAQIKGVRTLGQLSNKERSQIESINEALQANQDILSGTNGEYDEINSALKEQEEKEKKIQKNLGITGGVLKGISKIPILGDVVDADSAVKAMEESLREGGSQTKALSAGFKSMGGSLMSSLGPANLLLGAITMMIKTLIGADKAAGDYAKNMNVTYSEALDTRLELAKMANLSGDVALTSEKLMNTSVEVGKALGTNAQLNEADLKTMTKLTNQAGFTADELMNIQKLSLANGKSLESNTKSILGGAKAYARRNKIAVNEKTILKEVNSMSASLKLSLGGSGDAMAKAAVQAKKFGINLAQAESIASSLLDFESSIENELSAELLIGRDLNLEKARGLALNGNAAEAAAEMLKQVGSSVQYGEMNVIQQEAIAKSMGMQREELAKSLIESEALKSIGVESVEAAKEKYDKLRETMSAEEAAKALNDEALATQFEQQSVSEQMADSTAKMQEIFIMMTPALQSIGEILNVIFGVIGTIMAPVQMLFDLFGSIGKSISNLIGPLGKVGKVLKGVASIAVIYAAYKAYASLATIPVVGVPLGIAAAAAVTAMGFGALSKIKDGAIDPKGGMIVSGEKGSIQLDSEDSIIAGTDLFGGKKKPKNPTQPQGGGNTSVNVDMTQTNALLQQLISVISAGGDVMLDGQKVGTALNLTAYKTQ
tara:strand:- start:61 stop:2457 length:2397 start_codon:yes stop_codon:yes gene_type:complete